jgi:microcystin-dependent protein
LYYRDASGNFTRLAIGTSSQVLKGGTTPSYDTIASVLGYTPVNQGGDTMTGALILNANPSTGLGAATKNYVDSAVAGRGVPIGTSIEYCGTADLNPDPDTGAVFFLEDGRAISRTTYATLFARLGTTYGAGNGTTTFNIPDSRECFIMAYKSGSSIAPSLGFKSGASTKTIANSNLPVTSPWSINESPHSHVETGSSSPGGGSGLVGGGGAGSGNTYLSTASATTGITLNSNTGGGQAINIMNPYIVKGKLIRVL